MEKYENDAKEYINDNSKSYRVTIKDNHQLEIVDQDKDLTFTITCPNEENENFHVWSESSVMTPHLQNLVEFCESSRCCDIKNILGKIDILLNEENDDGYDDDDDDDDDFGDYYVEDDPPEELGRRKIVQKEEEEDDEEIESFFGKGAATAAAFQRLRKDLKNMKTEAHKFGVEGNPRGDNLFIWDVKLTGFSTDTKLGKDLLDFAKKFNREPVVYLEMQFPQDYPMAPPFVRVIRPRFKFLTDSNLWVDNPKPKLDEQLEARRGCSGNTGVRNTRNPQIGHVTIGGSICMQMLTKSGWTPSNDIESILVQIRSEIMSDNNARLDGNPDREYGEAEARDAFNRMVSRYGW